MLFRRAFDESGKPMKEEIKFKRDAGGKRNGFN